MSNFEADDVAGGGTVTGLRLRIDPVACDGVGLCAVVAARVVVLDRWGFAIMPESLNRKDEGAARAAVRGCPRRALWLQEIPELSETQGRETRFPR